MANEQDENDSIEAIPLIGNSLCFFSKNNPFRVFLRDMLVHPYFDKAIYTLILLSCIVLCLDEPVKLDYTERFLNIMNYLILALFTIELLMKSIVLGFIKGKNSYLKDS